MVPTALANVVNQPGFSLSVENAVVTTVVSVGGMKAIVVGVATRWWTLCLVATDENSRRVEVDDTNEQVFNDDDFVTNPFDRIGSGADEEMNAFIFIL